MEIQDHGLQIIFYLSKPVSMVKPVKRPMLRFSMTHMLVTSQYPFMVQSLSNLLALSQAS